MTKSSEVTLVCQYEVLLRPRYLHVKNRNSYKHCATSSVENFSPSQAQSQEHAWVPLCEVRRSTVCRSPISHQTSTEWGDAMDRHQTAHRWHAYEMRCFGHTKIIFDIRHVTRIALLCSLILYNSQMHVQHNRHIKITLKGKLTCDYPQGQLVRILQRSKVRGVIPCDQAFLVTKNACQEAF